jgi:hypothetical protein
MSMQYAMTHEWGRVLARSVRVLLVLLGLTSFLLAVSPAFATTAEREANFFVIGSAQAQASAQRLHDEEFYRIKVVVYGKTQEISRLKSQLQLLSKSNGEMTATNKRSRRKIADLLAKIERLEAERDPDIARQILILDTKDPAFAESLPSLRETAMGLSSTPQGAKCLAIFNGGDQAKGADCARLVADEAARAEQKLSAIRIAKQYRGAANLTWQAYTNGELPRETAIADYERVVGLDPGVSFDWLQLTSLYLDAMQFEKAKLALGKAEKLSKPQTSKDLEYALGYRRSALDDLVYRPQPEVLIFEEPQAILLTHPATRDELDQSFADQIAHAGTLTQDFELDEYKAIYERMKGQNISPEYRCLLDTLAPFFDKDRRTGIPPNLAEVQRDMGELRNLIDSSCEKILTIMLQQHPKNYNYVFLPKYLLMTSAMRAELNAKGDIVPGGEGRLMQIHLTLLAQLRALREPTEVSYYKESREAAISGLVSHIACFAGELETAKHHNLEVNAFFEKLVRLGATGMAPRRSLVSESSSYLSCMFDKDHVSAVKGWQTVFDRLTEPKIDTAQSQEIQISWVLWRYLVEKDLKHFGEASRGLDMLRSLSEEGVKRWSFSPSLRWYQILAQLHSGDWSGHPDGYPNAIALFDKWRAEPFQKVYVRPFQSNLIDKIRRLQAEKEARDAKPVPH